MGAHEIYKRNPAFYGAWKRGRRAGLNGEPRSTCPYDEVNANVGGRDVSTWRRAFARYWREGWEVGLKRRKGLKREGIEWRRIS